MKAILTTTNLKNKKYWETEKLNLQPRLDRSQVSIFPKIEKQTFQGFGGAFTEAAAYTWQKLPQDRRKAFMEAYFGENGLRYNLGRTHMGSCDFALGNYSCREKAEDSFDASRDEQYLIPMIKAAQDVLGKPVAMMLSPWSPPAFMKSNGDRNHGGKLLAEYAALWAKYLAEYVTYYRERGIDVRHVTVQNEPDAIQTWDSCIFSGQDEGHFAVEYLRPALDAVGCSDVKILAWDHNKEMLPLRAEDTLSVPGAEEAVDGFALHWYTGDHFNALTLTQQMYPGKELWFTEGCVEYSHFEDSGSQQKAEMYAHDIIGNLNGGICGSIDWNLIVDSKGGPNHAGNLCEAPIMLKDDERDYEIRSEYYYLGQFSRHIQPGAVCLGCSTFSPNAEAAALRNPDGAIVVVLLNRSDSDQEVCVSLDSRQGFCLMLAAHSIATMEIRA